MEWNSDLEHHIKNDAEQCETLFWMHNEAAKLSAKRNDIIQIPAIILASATGFLSATSVLIPPVGIGAMALTVGIFNTVNAYYRFGQISESYRITAQLYMKAYKIVESELALPIHQRKKASRILGDLRTAMVRIGDVAPTLPSIIIDRYNHTYKSSFVRKPILATGPVPITICTTTYEKPPEVINIQLPPTVDMSANTIHEWPSIHQQK